MSKRNWILIASIIPALSLTFALLLFMSPNSEAAPISTISSSSSENVALNQSCGYQTNMLADNPIAYWRLDETNGLTAANIGSLGSAVNGTYSNGVTLGETGLVSRDSNLAAQFDGVDDYIDIPSNDEINLGIERAERTIELWFSASALSGTQVLYEEGGQNNGFNIFLDDDDLHVGTWVSQIGTWVTQTVLTDTTYHVALAFEGSAGTVTGYLNGMSFGSAVTGFDSVPLHPGLIAIGAVHDGSRYPSGSANYFQGDHFNGIIDDVALYNSLLSPDRIQLHAAGCAISSTTTIVDDKPDPSAVGHPITVAFSVMTNLPGSIMPTGSVTVTSNSGSGNCVGILSAGGGKCQITPTITGTHTLTATYGGDLNFTGSSDTELHKVNEFASTTAILTDTPEPSVVGQPVKVSFSATAALPGNGTPTGLVTVTISGGSDFCMGTLTAGEGQCLITPIGAGNRSLTATYRGDDHFASSSDTEPHTVIKANTTTTIMNDTPEPSTVGQPVMVTFSVIATLPGSGTPGGNVTVSFSGGSESCVGTLVAGTGQCLITPTSAGTRTLTATYGGNANYNGSNGIEQHAVSEDHVLLYLPFVSKP